MDQPSSSAETAGAPGEQGGIWRDEVQARVAGYRSRRGKRIEGAFSMRFPFPPTEAPAALEAAERAASAGDAPPEITPEATVQTTADSAKDLVESAGAPVHVSPGPSAVSHEEDPGPAEEFAPPPAPAPRRKRKVIAFPRPVPDPAYPYDDPFLSEHPRILEAPQESAFPATPLLDGLRFPGQEQQTVAASADHVELPLQAVPLSQRIYAGLLDCTVVAAAAGIFAAGAYKMFLQTAPSKPLVLVLSFIPFLLWAVYQYLFVVYGGGTVGMRLAKIRLSSFKGGVPGWGQRRIRAVSLYFAAASLMMGVLWALVDVDRLCWHDRISRTYLVKI